MGAIEINLANRELLVEALREDIIGPISKKEGMIPLAQSERIVLKNKDELYKNRYYQQANGEEIIQRNNPSAYYVSGMIYPFNQKSEKDDSDSLKIEIDVEGQEDTIKSEVIEKLVDKIDGYEKTNEDTKDSVERLEQDLMPQKNEYLPSSFGISFYCHLNNQEEIIFRFTSGRYKMQSIFTEDNSQKQTWWFRQPIKCEIPISADVLTQNDKRMFKIPIKHLVLEGMVVELNILSRKTGDTYLVTASITNRSKLEGTSQSKLDEKTLFQCQLEVVTRQGEILPYPKIALHKQDEDELSNSLLYRNMHTYALGHGCSAEWHTNSIVKQISTTFLPKYETESMTPDIEDAFGNKIALSMLELGNMKNDANHIVDMLTHVTKSYKVWIENQSQKISDLETEQLQKTARLHMQRCQMCLERMEKGLDLLNDETVLSAFKLANQAMLLQQVNGVTDRGGILKEGKISFKKPYKAYRINDDSIEETGKGKWRAFQIAFILMALESTTNKESLERELVDLIWFPTGGGKTEAYLGLAAFSMFYRRIKNQHDIGVDILMRYTLRLLTADQFQRSSRLICAMEVLRKENEEVLGTTPFSIGIWLGSETSPNNNEEAAKQLNNLMKNKKGTKEFLVHNCPWCGAKLGYYVSEGKKGKFKEKSHHGYKIVNTELVLYCPDELCDFHEKLPVHIVDETIYKRTPSFLIGTIDKFAMLTWVPQARSIFGIDGDGTRVFSPPNLIIQDELHLISGALGTISGLYETLIEELCTDSRDNKVSRAKIVCATATIRKSEEQIRSLYARINSQVFPSPGIEHNDSFFARPAKDEAGNNKPGRLYIGIYSPTVEKLTLQVKSFGTLLQVVQEFEEEDKDPFYTLLSFYNSIREIGSAMTLIQTDIPNYFKQVRFKRNINNKEQWRWINNADELTSRLSSGEVTNAIGQLKQTVGKYPTDVCLASNIIEVGVDIDRLSLMTIVGQPKTTAQYIQVSGRVGRRWWERPGLVVTLYGSGRSRDKSHYEHFIEYHQKLYGQVEPTSVTPFSDPCLHRVLPGVIIGYIRQMLDKDIAQSPENIKNYKAQLIELRRILVKRAEIIEPKQVEALKKEYGEFVAKYLINGKKVHNWKCKVNDDSRAIMYMAGTYVTPEQGLFSVPVMTSMRNVDVQCKGKITDILDEYSIEEICWDDGEEF